MRWAFSARRVRHRPEWETRRVRRAWLFAPGPLVAAVLGAIAVPMMAWVFPPEDVGRLSLLQVVISLGVVVLFLGLDQAYVREFHEGSESQGELYAASIYPPLGLFLVLCVAVAVSPAALASLLYGEPHAGWAWGTTACIGVALFVRSWTLIVRMQDRGIIFSIAQVLPRLVLVGLISVVAAFAVAPDFRIVLLLVLVSSASGLVPLGIATWRTWAFNRPRANLPLLRGLLAFGLPLAAATLAYTLLTSLGTISLRINSSFDQLGAYGVATSVAGAAVVLQTIFSVVWAPALYRAAADGASDAKRLASIARDAMLAIVTLAFAVCGTFSWVLDLLLPSEYAVVKILVIGTVVQPLLYSLSEVTGAGIGVTRRSGYALLATILGVVVGATACGLLVGPYGAVGAVAATSMALGVFFVVRSEASARIWHRYPRARMYLLVGGALALVLVSLWLGQRRYQWIQILWCLYGVTSIVVCRSFWLGLVRPSGGNRP